MIAMTAMAVAAVSAGAKAVAPPVPHIERADGRAYIADERGNELLLRGINSNALVHYPDYFRQTVPLRYDDFREMRALGFNFLRLPINWSRLAPQPGAFSEPYLKRIERKVTGAERHGMRVVVDFHQDRYNRNLRPGDEADGAPDWATLTDGKPCLEGMPLTSPCSAAAYDHFWNNTTVAGQPLQDHYRDAMLVVSRRLRDHNGMLGLELMNEPTPGSTQSPAFEREQLWPFQRRMIRALRQDGERRLIWFGPSILRDVLDYDVGRPERFSRDRNLVYAPHVYTGTFNSGDEPELEASYAAAVEEARAYDAALVDGEWGGGNDEKAERMRAAKLDLQDDHLVGSGFWMWKQRPGFYNWHTVEEDGALRQDSMRAQQLSRPHLNSAPGRIISTSYEDDSLQARIRSRGGRAEAWSGTVVLRGGETLLERPLVRVAIDGERVRPRLRRAGYRPHEVGLLGYRVRVRIPRGVHDVELTPGPLRPRRAR